MPPLGCKSALHCHSQHHKYHSKFSVRLQPTGAIIRVKSKIYSTCQSARVVNQETIHCFALKCSFVSLYRIRGQWGGGVSVLIKGTAAGDKLTAVIVSVCHRTESETSTIHHREKLHFFLSLAGFSDKGWMKKNDREIGLVHYLSQSNRGRLYCMLNHQTLLLLLFLLAYFI